MHESRHEHALRRIRGPDGRFLKKNDIETMIKRVSHIVYSFIEQGEIKLNTPDTQHQVPPMDRAPLPIQFSGLPLPVVDQRISGMLASAMTMEQPQHELPNVNDKGFQYYNTPDGQEAAL